MGTWGHGIFDNDSAADWASDLGGFDDLSFIEEAIDAVLESEDFVDADVGTYALAASETLARLRGNFGVRDAYTEPMDKWVAAHPLKPTPALIARADKAITRVLSEDSELRELWSESDEAAWLATVEDLRKRLNA